MKLQIAAKGTAEAISGKIATQFAKVQKQMGGDQKAEAKDEKAQDDKKEKEEQIDRLQIQLAEIEFLAMNVINTDVTRSNPRNHKLWKSSLQKVLTDTQKKKLETAEAARIKKYRKAAVTFAANDLGLQLMLSDDQIKKVAVVLDKKLGARIAKTADLPSQYREQVQWMVYSIPVTVFKPILSEKQMSAWKATRNQQQVGPGIVIDQFEAADEGQDDPTGQIKNGSYQQNLPHSFFHFHLRPRCCILRLDGAHIRTSSRKRKS